MTDPKVTEEPILEATLETTDLVKKEMPDATDEAIAETAALFEAIKKRAGRRSASSGRTHPRSLFKSCE